TNLSQRSLPADRRLNFGSDVSVMQLQIWSIDTAHRAIQHTEEFPMATSPVASLIFDVEAVGDGDLISKVRYSGQGLSGAEALQKYRNELMEQTGRDVLPPTFVLPIS